MAEVVVGEIGRAIGLLIPEMRAVTLDGRIAKFEADEEVQDLLSASVGLNLGVDFLPGSFGYDGSAPPSPQMAATVLWLDAFTANIDRTWSNPNLLVWHGRTWAIDHGAALYFHHSWPNRGHNPLDTSRFANQPFGASRHVLLEVADDLVPVHHDLAALVGVELIDDVPAQVPDEWLELTAALPHPQAVRSAYRLNPACMPRQPVRVAAICATEGSLDLAAAELPVRRPAMRACGRPRRVHQRRRRPAQPGRRLPGLRLAVVRSGWGRSAHT